MNKHDSERISGILANLGYEEVSDNALANLIIFNTCCVRKNADERLYGNLGHLKSLKKSNPNTIIAVCGCLAQKDKEKIQEKVPFVDLVFGPQNIYFLPELIEKARQGRVCDTTENNRWITDKPLSREHPNKAWIPVIVGCDNHCSYCVVPSVRGAEKSRPLEDIVSEVQMLADDGVLEITLLGQNVNSYGKDIYGQPKFAALLEQLNLVDKLKRIRFTTSHPKDLTGEVIDKVKNLEKVCEHIHLPVQAGSSLILKLMNRKYTKESYLNLAYKIRNEIKNVSITTDIMVGFPQETENDFLETLDVVSRVEFDQAFTFIFSSRDNTVAAKMGGQLSEKVKLERYKRLLELQDKLTLESNKKYQGKIVEVLVEGKSKKDPSLSFGRTRQNKIVNFAGEVKTGDLVNVEITQAKTWYLLGEEIRVKGPGIRAKASLDV